MNMYINGNYNDYNNKKPLLFFIDGRDNYYSNYRYYSSSDSKIFSLLDENILQVIPKNLTITTRSGSCKFNLKMLIETSKTISSFIEELPQNLEFNLDIDDDEHVLNKFEQLYQGQKVFFKEKELPICKQITKKLQILNCPNYMKPNDLWQNNTNNIENPKNGIKICGLDIFFKNNAFQTFSIKTKKRKYKCNIFGIYSSKVIRDFIEQNPKEKQFLLDFKDENEEFQSICKVFNFEQIKITKKNSESLKEMAEILQIQYLSDEINDYLNKEEKMSQKIDEQQKIVDSIDELFEWLYNIKEKTVQSVKELIIKSEWIETEENVQELAAFILQVVKTDILLQPYLIDLLIELKEEANKFNYLHILIPFIVSKLNIDKMPCGKRRDNYSFRNIYINNDMNENLSPSFLSFIYKLYKKGIIPKDEIINSLNSSVFYSYDINFWFLPLLIEMNPNYINLIQNCMENSNDNQKLNFIKPFLPDKIDLYEQMLDGGEPYDALTKSIRNDDVDTMQSIITSCNINTEKTFVPFNIFDEILYNQQLNYLNYAALNGSIKCFKYLLLNHDSIDKDTFKFAVYGGNIEIIKIICQESPIFNNRGSLFIEQILYSITKHRNDLFDWILDNQRDLDYNDLNSIAIESAKNGNIHSFIGIFDKGLDAYANYTNIVVNASSKGFYKFLKFIVFILEKNKQNGKLFYSSNSYKDLYLNSVYFGNISIFKLFKEQFNQYELQDALCFSISNDYINMIDYFFKGIIKKEIEIEYLDLFNILNSSLYKESDELFIYLLKKINTIYPNINMKVDLLYNLLISACKFGNFPAVKNITDIILNKESNKEFTTVFITALSNNLFEFCKYFFEKKVLINFNEILLQNINLGSLNVDLFSFIINNVDYELLTAISQTLDQAIRMKNKDLIIYLFNEYESFLKYENSLISAISTNDLDIVDIILKYNSKPSFINKIIYDKTALTEAVYSRNLDILKRLLSIPGINPSIYTFYMKPSLIIAININNIESINAILDYYGDSIQYEKYILENAIESILLSYINLYGKTKPTLDVINRILEIKYIDPNYFYVAPKENENSDDDDDSNNSNNKNEEEEEFEEYNQTFLLCACKKNDIDMVKRLLQLDKIDVNIFSDYRHNTALIVAVKYKFSEIAELLIKHQKTNINHINRLGKTALVYAVENKLENILNLLINDKRFDSEESQLNYAFTFANYYFATKFLSFDCLDVNFMIKMQNNQSFTTKLIKSVQLNDVEMIDLIINHPSFDKNKSLIKTAIVNSIKNKNIKILQKLLKVVNDDVNICSFSGFSLLFLAAYFSNIKAINFILDNEKFDSKKSDILKSFVAAYSKNRNQKDTYHIYEIFYENENDEEEEVIDDDNEYSDSDTNIKSFKNLDIMKILCNYDKEHEKLIDFKKLLPDGKSFFTTIYCDYKEIKQVIDFLIEQGVDPNMPDENDVFPLEKAISLRSCEFALSLINSNKIDYTVKIPKKIIDFANMNNSYIYINNSFTTYLHLAAKSNRSDILILFLNRNLIDVNITDSLGNTPLMEALNYHQYEYISYFFEKDDLDYLHKNIKGNDALSIINNKYANIERESIKDKRKYLEELMKNV